MNPERGTAAPAASACDPAARIMPSAAAQQPTMAVMNGALPAPPSLAVLLVIYIIEAVQYGTTGGAASTRP